MENTFFRDLSILWSLVFCVVMFISLYESKYSPKKTTAISIPVIIILSILNMTLLLICGVEKTAQLIAVTMVIPTLVLFYILAKNRDGRFFFTFCLVDTMVYWVLILTNLLDDVVGLGNYIVMFISRLIIFPILLFTMYKYIRKPYHEFQRKIKKGWGIFSVMSALFYILLLVATSYPTVMMKRHDDYPVIILITILIPIMYITVFKILYSQIKLFEIESEKQNLGMQVKIAHERISSSAENETNIKTLRHNMKHHMIVLNGYLENHDIENAQRELSKITEQIEQNSYHKYCSNVAINSVLSHYNKVMIEKGILFEIDIKLPEIISISDIDLAVVISNALDNALNAVENCQNKIIMLKAFRKEDKICFEIKNPFEGNIEFSNDLPITTKDGHGYGTKSIATIIKNNNGLYSFVAENGYFVFRCMI